MHKAKRVHYSLQGLSMHFHPINPLATNLYSAVTADDGAAKRAADVRKKLMSSTAEIQDELDSGKVQATSGHSNKDQGQSPDHKHHRDEEVDPSDDEDPDDPNPVSLWG